MLYNVVQVLPHKDFTIYVYFDDGNIRLYDMKPLIGKGIFKKISDPVPFSEKCTVLNNTLAWDIEGNYDPYTCIDIDPLEIYEKGLVVHDPLFISA